jgi:hypothetical protein
MPPRTRRMCHSSVPGTKPLPPCGGDGAAVPPTGGDDQPEDDPPCGGSGALEPGVWTPELLGLGAGGGVSEATRDTAHSWHALLSGGPSELRLAPTLMSGQSFRWERRVVNSHGGASAR